MTEEIQYTTDNKVTWFSTEEDVNLRLESMLGEKFTSYRKSWESASKFELETNFPLYLQLELSN